MAETQLTYEGHDEVVLDELWSFVGSKAQQAWVWIALSRRNLQVLAFHVGARDLQSARQLWEKVPAPWRKSLVFTDGYKVYQSLLADTPLTHCRCLKSDNTSWGETSVIEGANNALRQGVSYLGRKSLAFARSTHWLQARVHWFIHHWNHPPLESATSQKVRLTLPQKRYPTGHTLQLTRSSFTKTDSKGRVAFANIVKRVSSWN